MKISKLLGGTALTLLLTTGLAAAQTTTTTGASSTVGTPNTGFGGDLGMNLLLLGSTAIIAVAAAILLAVKRTV